VIVPYQDGPYLVRGPAVLRDQHGHEIEAVRRIIALCRCGKSQTRPFCDGTHRQIRFRASSESENSRPSGLVSSNGSTTPRAEPGDLAGASPRPLSIAIGLRQVHKQLANLIVGSDERQPAALLRTADSLIAAACLLVAPSARSPQSTQLQKTEWTEPCLCLVRGAIDTLVPLAGGSDRRVSEVVEKLAVLVMPLQAGVSRS
jgi:CDGSH-type Zn-finger protein